MGDPEIRTMTLDVTATGWLLIDPNCSVKNDPQPAQVVGGRRRAHQKCRKDANITQDPSLDSEDEDDFVLVQFSTDTDSPVGSRGSSRDRKEKQSLNRSRRATSRVTGSSAQFERDRAQPRRKLPKQR